MTTAVESSARIKVFWQPGCSSCLRTKEFLTKQGIDFESINVHNNPAGMAELAALGARSVPVVALGGKYTLCQSFNDVIKFLDLKTKLMDPLPPAQLVAKLELVLEAAARFTRQFSEPQLREVFRDRNRTPGGTAFHIFRVAEMGLQAAEGIELKFEGFNDQPPDDWSAEDIARWGLEVRERALLVELVGGVDRGGEVVVREDRIAPGAVDDLLVLHEAGLTAPAAGVFRQRWRRKALSRHGFAVV